MLITDPRWSAWNKDGTPCVGARLEVFLTGTDIKPEVYSDPQLRTPAQNPMTANERGLFPLFYVDTADALTIKITAPDGTLISMVEDYAPYAPQDAVSVNHYDMGIV